MMSRQSRPTSLPPDAKRPILDLDAVNAKLRNKRGPAYWRSLEEIAETPEFQAWVEDEFPNRRDLADLDRRSFLKFMGASLALAGLAGCRGVFLPDEKLIPYVKQPEEMTIGKPLYYATAVPIRGYAMGVLVEQREGRPIKLEGNPEHPISRGALDAQSQAQILNFYDPDRLPNVLNAGNISTWEQFAEVARQALAAQKVKAGSGLRILTETVTSPSLAGQIQRPAQGVSAGEVARLRFDRHRCPSGRVRGGVRRQLRHPVQPCTRKSDRRAGQRFPAGTARQRFSGAAVCRWPPKRARYGRNEPSLLDRIFDDDYRSDGRSPLAGQTVRSRRIRDGALRLGLGDSGRAGHASSVPAADVSAIAKGSASESERQRGDSGRRRLA